MSAPLLPYLPLEAMSCIALAALAMEACVAKAWVRLSLVCHAWRNSLRGAHPIISSSMACEHSADHHHT